MRIAINIASSYARFLTGIIAVFFLTPFTLGVVGLEQFGLWSLCLAVIGVLGLLDLGFATAAVKYVAECSGKADVHARNEAVSTLMLVYAALGIICLILVISAVPAGINAFALDASQAEIFRRVMTISGCALAVALPLSVFRSALIGSGRFDLVNLVETGTILLNALLVVVLLSNGWALTGLAIANASVMLAAPLALMVISRKVIPDFRIGFRLLRIHRLQEVAPLAVYFMLANIALLISLRSDALLIKAFLPLSAVAAYAIAAKIAEYSFLLNKQFSNALMPLVSRSAGAGDAEMVRTILVDGTRLLMIVAAPVLGLLFFHAESIVTLWVGPELHEVILPLRILLVAVFFSTLQLNAANVLGMAGAHRGVAWTMLGSAALNICLSFMLIPRMGLAGAAVSTLGAACLLEFSVMMNRACARQGVRRMTLLREVAPVLVCIAPMLVVAQWLSAYRAVNSFSELAMQGFAAAFCYLCMVSFAALKKQERTMVDSWIAQIQGSWRLGKVASEGSHHG
jgi:O-antigen/teichoic acid export membrane protein